MKATFGERLSFGAGAIYAMFFYVKFTYDKWDFLILWTGNIAFLVGLYLTYKFASRSKNEKNI